jgi:hypothetical protein
MVNSPNIPLYAHKSAINNYLYCVKYGYAFIVERCPDINDLNKDYMWDPSNEYLLVWSKPILVKRHLYNYEYLLIIDSDAIFIDFEKSLDYLINTYFTNDDICIIAGGDCFNSSTCWGAKDDLNAGVMLFKNIPKTFEILNNWYEAANNECIDWKYQHPREQQCLNILKSKYNNNIKVIPHYEMNGVDGIYIRHYLNNNVHSANDRNNYIDNYLQINYKNLTNETLPKNIENYTNINNCTNIDNDDNNNQILLLVIIVIFISSYYYYYYYKK